MPTLNFKKKFSEDMVKRPDMEKLAEKVANMPKRVKRAAEAVLKNPDNSKTAHIRDGRALGQRRVSSRIFKCTSCHHEWQSLAKNQQPCDWCGMPGRDIDAAYNRQPAIW